MRLEKGIQLYPNPVHENLNFEFDLSGIESIELSLFDLTGKAIHTWNIRTQGPGKEMLDVSSVASGIYLMKGIASNGSVWIFCSSPDLKSASSEVETDSS